MTKVLLVHNYYGSSAPSGEDRVFEAEKSLLGRHGHAVGEFVRRSDEIRDRGPVGIVRGGLATPWNPFSASAVRRTVQEMRPDVVHVHNTFPLVSPAVFHAVGGLAATVLTLHNYRLFCSAGIPSRDGRVCTECLDRRSAWPAVLHACYRGSRFATIPIAASVTLHRTIGTWTNGVDAFITLSEFQRERMIGAGLPSDRVHVKANFFPTGSSPIPWRDRGHYAVFAGRLTREKGVETLLRTWRIWGREAPELRILGDGGLRTELERIAHDLPVRFLGQVETAEAQRQISEARLLVFPSECIEGSPLAIIEAFAFGTPVAASDLGPLSSIVRHGENGVLFRPNDDEAMCRAIRDVWTSQRIMAGLGRGARESFEANHGEEANHAALLEIYERAIARSKARRLNGGAR